MADGGDDDSAVDESASKLQHALMSADEIGGETARDDQRVVIGRVRRLGRNIRHRRVTELGWVAFDRFRADEVDAATGFAQSVERIPDFQFLVLLLDQNGNAPVRPGS